MKTLALATLAAAGLAVAAPLPAAAQVDSRYGYAQDEEARFDAAQRRFAAELDAFRAAFDRYQQSRHRRPTWQDSRWDSDLRDEGDWDPARYYRADPRYRERVLRSDERVYRGRDGRYYCRRSDGTTGLIVGAFAGGVLGNLIDGGHSRTAGTLLGAILGGALGASVERNEIRCR